MLVYIVIHDGKYGPYIDGVFLSAERAEKRRETGKQLFDGLWYIDMQEILDYGE